MAFTPMATFAPTRKYTLSREISVLPTVEKE
ncbi:MAG: hypothetical protein ACJA16_001484 [Akkermansiaceae bacterium]|jgi:hypothetical protein